MKIRAFEDSADRIHAQLGLLLDPANHYQGPRDLEFVDGIVDAAVMPVFPSDADHLNPTFAFCRSTGFKPWRVRKSIADGCFQMFKKLIDSRGPENSPILIDAMNGLGQKGPRKRIPDIEWQTGDGRKDERGECPFFLHSAKTEDSQKEGRLVTMEKPGAFTCPFYAAWKQLSGPPMENAFEENDREQARESALAALGIYHECITDESHRSKRPRPPNYKAKLPPRSARATAEHAEPPAVPVPRPE